MNKVLVINNGSTSFRFKVINIDDYSTIASGGLENILKDNCYLKYSNGMVNIKEPISVSSYQDIISTMNNLLFNKNIGVIKDKKEILAIGYRVVHGGELFNDSVVIDQDNLDKIKKLSELMPVHGDSTVNSIEICSNIYNDSIPVAVFDTSFHSTIPKENYLYPIPIEYYNKYGIRKYGFHGISYSSSLKKYLSITSTNRDNYNGVICHLGGGSSMCAIKDGKSYDTTMEFTPSSGMIMASRCGNIDPMALFYLMKKENMSVDDIVAMINKESGYKALCNDTDMKSIVDRSENNDESAIFTRKMIDVDFKKNLFSMMADLDTVDSIILTGGIGTKNKEQREMLMGNLEPHGIIIDKNLNNSCFNQDMRISSDNSKIPIFVITDDEEIEIASECKKIIKRRI